MTYSKIQKSILRFAWAPLLVFIAHAFISRALRGYSLIPSIDIPMHVLGGFVIAYFFSQVLASVEPELFYPQHRRILHVIIVFLAVGTTTVFWEFAEFTKDQLFQGHSQGSIQDTMGDMLCGMLGGITYLIFRRLKDYN